MFYVYFRQWNSFSCFWCSIEFWPMKMSKESKERKKSTNLCIVCSGQWSRKCRIEFLTFNFVSLWRFFSGAKTIFMCHLINVISQSFGKKHTVNGTECVMSGIQNSIGRLCFSTFGERKYRTNDRISSSELTWMKSKQTQTHTHTQIGHEQNNETFTHFMTFSVRFGHHFWPLYCFSQTVKKRSILRSEKFFEKQIWPIIYDPFVYFVHAFSCIS